MRFSVSKNFRNDLKDFLKKEIQDTKSILNNLNHIVEKERCKTRKKDEVTDSEISIIE